jgi:hypothetical protein
VVSHTWPEMLFESLAKLGCMSWLWIGQVSQTFWPRPWNLGRAGSCDGGNQQKWLEEPPCDGAVSHVLLHGIYLSFILVSTKGGLIEVHPPQPLPLNLEVLVNHPLLI